MKFFQENDSEEQDEHLDYVLDDEEPKLEVNYDNEEPDNRDYWGKGIHFKAFRNFFPKSTEVSNPDV
jgi:hypothetical protein